jgi:PAS domain S-box-containing protein
MYSRSLIEASLDPLATIGPDGTIADLNAATEVATGCTRQELIGTDFSEYFTEPEKARAGYEQAFREGQVRDYALDLRHRDGRTTSVLYNAAVYRDEDGRVAGVFAAARDLTERRRLEEQLQVRLREVEDLKQQLEHENIYLREEVKQLSAFDEIVGRSDLMRDVLAQVNRVAATDSTVLITGETGTGKELVARAIHGVSKRKDRALVTINCASLPPSLIESELFGREKGAYTGALTMMKGRFEVADGSTIFLDEIGELGLEVQAKLLRVLEEGRFERLGSPKPVHVNVRIIAATNRDLAQDVQDGKFRKDLYYRLNVFPIGIPPLRERSEDIPLLVWAVVREFEKKMGKRVESIPKRSLEALQRYAWPGNVRELRNVIERAMIVSSGKSLDLHIPAMASAEPVKSQALEDVERTHILSVLQKTRWRLMGQGGAAERLGLKRTTLQSRMKKLGIKRPTS